MARYMLNNTDGDDLYYLAEINGTYVWIKSKRKAKIFTSFKDVTKTAFSTLPEINGKPNNLSNVNICFMKSNKRRG